LARIPDVISLAQSAGIDTGTEDLSVNQFPTTALIDLLGMTFIDENGSFWSAGYLDDFSGPPPSFCPCRQSAFLFVGFRTETAGLTFLDDIGLDLDLLFETTGLMLYRQVPEPTAISLAVILVIIWAPIWRLKSRLRRR